MFKKAVNSSLTIQLPFDELISPPLERVTFDHVLERAYSRRQFLSTVGMGAAAFVCGVGVCKEATASNKSLLDFKPISANSKDTVTVPEGFNWHIVASWGDPMWSEGVVFDNETRGTATSQALAFGDNTDGMAIFVDDGRQILAVNNESVNRNIMYGNRNSGLAESLDDIKKAMMAHGICIFEIAEKNGLWQIIQDSPYNRKITAETKIEITGPARGHDLLKTSADSMGTEALGTWNNCGNGKTPWGTYLACEENFNDYFLSDDKDLEISPLLKRYGVGHEDRGYQWGKYDSRFNINKEPNEPNRSGYVVEIDPLKPESIPKKRTALGRFKHENAEVVVASNGHIVVYLGDDERGEFLYKFISKNKYSEHGNNADLLENGTLYAAQFCDDGRGQWLVLTPESTGLARAEICIYTRIAASRVGATTMDRPEWVAINPDIVEAYCCLTNNKDRGIKPNKGGDQTSLNGPNPRIANKYGQIVRWVPDNEDHSLDTFSWNLFVIAGNPDVYPDSDKAGSNNITSANIFNSPDGLHFDTRGGLWIQTDGKYSDKGDFAGMGNNQMLLGNTTTGEIKRFLVGPNESEVTGISWSEDKKTMFVGIQHPGQKGNSNFPGGAGTVPRSSIIAIRRDDGGEVG